MQEEKRINEEPSKNVKVIVVKTSPHKKNKGATIFLIVDGDTTLLAIEIYICIYIIIFSLVS